MAVSTAHKKKNASKAKMKNEGYLKTAEKIHQETMADMMYVNKTAERASSKTDDPEILKAIEEMRNMANRKVEQVGKMKDDDNGDAQHRSKFKEWGQLNLDIEQVSRLIALQTANRAAAAMQVFFFIAREMDRENAYIASYKVFEEALGMSKATVQRALNVLQKHGLLGIAKTGGANIYVLDDDIVWKGYGNTEGTIKLDSKVRLSEEETKKYKEVVENLKKFKSIPTKVAHKKAEKDE